MTEYNELFKVWKHTGARNATLVQHILGIYNCMYWVFCMLHILGEKHIYYDPIYVIMYWVPLYATYIGCLFFVLVLNTFSCHFSNIPNICCIFVIMLMKSHSPVTFPSGHRCSSSILHNFSLFVYMNEVFFGFSPLGELIFFSKHNLKKKFLIMTI